MPVIELIAFALVVGSLLLVLALFVRGSFMNRRERRREALATRLRPAAVALVDTDTEEPAPELSGLENQVFASLLRAYARRVSGDARDRIGGYFEARGHVDEQLRLLRSRRVWRRATAAFRLGDMCSQRPAPELLRALDDRARDVRMAAARSLGRLGVVDAIEPLIATAVARRLPRDVAALALIDIGSTGVPPLLELAVHEDPRVRSTALELVGLLGDAGDAKPVLDHMRDPAAAVRAASAEALGRLGAAESRDALVRALDDRVPVVRATAAQALRTTGGRRTAEALVAVARGDVFEPARAAAESLARLDPVLLVETASNPDAGPHLREAADRADL